MPINFVLTVVLFCLFACLFVLFVLFVCFCQGFTDSEGIVRVTGEEWLVRRPGAYLPSIEEMVNAFEFSFCTKHVIIHARTHTHTHTHTHTLAHMHAHIHAQHAQVVRYLEPITITEKVALHLRAKLDHKDSFGVLRVAGEEWLVTQQDCNSYLVDVTEESVGVGCERSLACISLV